MHSVDHFKRLCVALQCVTSAFLTERGSGRVQSVRYGFQLNSMLTRYDVKRALRYLFSRLVGVSEVKPNQQRRACSTPGSLLVCQQPNREQMIYKVDCGAGPSILYIGLHIWTQDLRVQLEYTDQTALI